MSPALELFAVFPPCDRNGIEEVGWYCQLLYAWNQTKKRKEKERKGRASLNCLNSESKGSHRLANQGTASGIVEQILIVE